MKARFLFQQLQTCSSIFARRHLKLSNVGSESILCSIDEHNFPANKHQLKILENVGIIRNI